MIWRRPLATSRRRRYRCANEMRHGHIHIHIHIHALHTITATTIMHFNPRRCRRRRRSTIRRLVHQPRRMRYGRHRIRLQTGNNISSS